MAGLILLLRRLRDERAVSLALVGLLLVTELVAAAAPRLLADESDRSLRSEVAAAGSRERSVQLVAKGRLDTSGTTGLEAPQSLGKSFETAFDPAVEALVRSRSIVVETPLWQVDAGSPGAVVTLRIQQGVESHIALVAGHLPGGTVRSEPAPGSNSVSPAPVPAFEAAVSAAAAARMGIGVGDSLSSSVQTNDPRSAEHKVAVVVDIVAIYDVVDPTDEFWIDDDAVLHSITYQPSPTEDHAQAALLLSPDALPGLMSATAAAALPMTYTWRCYVDSNRLDAGQLDALVAAMRRLEATYPPGTPPTLPAANTAPKTPTSPPATVSAALQSGLLRLLETHRTKWQTAETVLVMAATGTGAVACGMVWLVVLLAARRRRSAVTLARRRGASLRRVLAATVVEAMILSIPPAVLAVWLAAVAIPDRAGLPSIAAAGSIAGLGIAALVATAFGKGGMGGDQPADATAGDAAGMTADASIPARNRRLVVEGAIVAAAIGGAYLLRERAIAAAGAGGAGSVAPDQLIEAVPALAGLAAAIVAIRLYPMLMGLAGRLAAIRRDLVPFLAMRHAARGPGAGAVLLVLIMTATVGTFAASVLATLDRSVDAVAWQQVGAPYRVDSVIGQLNAGLDPTRWPGVEAVASASQDTVALNTGGFRVLETIDMAQYQAIVSGSPADPGIPAEMLGRADEPLPAIVSTQASGSFDKLAVGDVFSVRLGRVDVRFRAVAERSSFPGLPAGQPFIVVSRQQLAAIRPEAVPATTSFFVKAPDEAAGAMRAALGPRTEDTTIVSRAEQAGALRTAPIVAAVTAGIGASAAVAILCAALAVAAALFLSASARALETSHLRTLGLARGQAAALIVAEFGPAVLVALAVGASLGLGLFLYLRPGLALGTVVGSPLETPAAVALPQLVMMFMATALTAAIAIALAAASQRAASPAAAIRRGIE